MSTEAIIIGDITCQPCGTETKLKESKMGGVNYTCPACGWQGLGRTPKSVAAMRALVKQPPAPPAAPAPAPSPDAKPKRDARNPW